MKPTLKLIKGDRKDTPTPDTCSICQKIITLKLENKNNVILSVGNIHRVQRCIHSLFSSCLMQLGEEYLQLRLKCTAQYFVSILVMCAGNFCTLSPLKPPKGRNPVAIDPGIDGATSFEK
jgi:hypothetical protein